MTAARNKRTEPAAAAAEASDTLDPAQQAATPIDDGAPVPAPSESVSLVPPPHVADKTVVEATNAMERARAALDAAEAEFAAAEFVAERARIEDQRRRDRAEDERIGRLGQSLPKLRAAVEFDLNQFRIAVAGIREEGVTMDQVVRSWMQMSHTREVLRRVMGQITAHTAKRSDVSFKYWERKAAEWDVALRAALDLRPYGMGPLSRDILTDAAKDKTGAAAVFVDALAKVNEMINEQSQEAPVPLKRLSYDVMPPGPSALGVFSGSQVFDPLFRERPMPRDFSRDFDEALIHAVQAEVNVYMPNISLLSLGGVDVVTARRLAAGAAAKLQNLSQREDDQNFDPADIRPAGL